MTADPVIGTLVRTAAATAPRIASDARARLLEGAHHDPHSLLGCHPDPAGTVLRCLRPGAVAVAALTDGVAWELPHTGDGLFAGRIPGSSVPSYRLRVTYPETVVEQEDPYRFLPALGELDLHLIQEGRHEELWTALGARIMEHQGVSGTRFTVWAPRARGVRLVGDFGHWDGTATPMRSLGHSGVWELFVPGIGEGELYKFEILGPDGSRRQHADPMARRTEKPPATASVVDASHYAWRDEEWLARRTERPGHEAPFSVYEIHLPSWRPGLTYRQLADQLPAY
ncbi:1,4-alpha-glucan branching enzyme, partial [Streptomyces sp. PsTaAH-137]